MIRKDSSGYLIVTRENPDLWIPAYNFEPKLLRSVTYCKDGVSVCEGQCIDCPDTAKLSFDFKGEDKSVTKEDKINHPSHYTMGSIEVFAFIKAWELSFAEGNVVKYVVRAPHKGRPVDDLKKARWYLDQLIQKAEDDNS